jgi:hypothetical protein
MCCSFRLLLDWSNRTDAHHRHALAEHFGEAVRNFETLEAALGERDTAPHLGDAYRHVARFAELIGALH